jgi:hypothetical protein
VYVAAMGNLWKPNDMRGVYRSKDGGNTWERILFESDKAGAVDIILDPNNPRIIYASTWEIKRNGYRMDSGGPGSHLWKSTDGGDTWEKLTNKPGLPKGVWGIVGIAVSPVNSERIWAIIENEDGGVFRSDDGGATWQLTSDNRNLRQRAWYYSRMFVMSAFSVPKMEVRILNLFQRRTEIITISGLPPPIISAWQLPTTAEHKSAMTPVKIGVRIIINRPRSSTA